MACIGVLGSGLLGKRILSVAPSSIRTWGTFTEEQNPKKEDMASKVLFQWENIDTWNNMPKETSSLIVTIPPIFQTESTVIEHLHQWCAWLKGNLKLLSSLVYISTTSVYPMKAKTWREEDTIEETTLSSRLRICTENIFQNYFPCCTLRSGAIYGPGRNIVSRILSNRSIPASDTPVHRIHVTDLANIALKAALTQPEHKMINCCDVSPDPSRILAEWVIKNRELFSIPPGQELVVDEQPLRKKGRSFPGRFISNDLLLHKFGYRLIYPDWKSGLISCFP